MRRLPTGHLTAMVPAPARTGSLADGALRLEQGPTRIEYFNVLAHHEDLDDDQLGVEYSLTDGIRLIFQHARTRGNTIDPTTITLEVTRKAADEHLPDRHEYRVSAELR